MSQNLRILLFQMDTLTGNIHQNLNKIEKLVSDQAGDFDILLLPEMFNTGYVVDKDLLLSEWQEVTLSKLMSLCRLYDIRIMGSIPFYDTSLWYNSMFLFDKNGAKRVYDKMHLFGLGGEKSTYHMGDKTSEFWFSDWLIQPLICYDLRFPYAVNSREHPHLLIYSAQWPQPRIEHWKALLRARAIEHQCFVAGVNRFGRDPGGIYYFGSSLVFDYSGNEMASCGEEESFFICHLNKIHLESYRQKFPFIQDWQV